MNDNTIKEIIVKELLSKNLIFPFVSGLSQREKAVLSYREQDKKLQWIGKKLGNLTRERVRQIELKAKAKNEYSRRIVETLAKKIGEVVFTERDVEWAFLKTEKGKLAEKKVKWQSFCRVLWQFKQKQ